MTTTINAKSTGIGGLDVTCDASGSLGLQTGGTTAVTIDTSQNVGIGTTSPLAKLHVGVGADTPIVAATTIYASNNGATVITTRDSTNDVESYIGSYSTGTWLGSASNHPAIFTTNNLERMRIDSSGRPLFNTTSALNAGYMSLLFDGSAYNGFTLKTSYATLGSVYLYFINSAGNVAGYVTQNGTTTVNYVTSSDYRMKENVVPITNALDRVAKLKPVTYIWKDTNNEQGEGFIAHELQEVCPLAVSGEKDAVNEDGTIKPQGIDTSKLVATLTAAIQEQQTIINDLKARIETLESK